MPIKTKASLRLDVRIQNNRNDEKWFDVSGVHGTAKTYIRDQFAFYEKEVLEEWNPRTLGQPQISPPPHPSLKQHKPPRYKDTHLSYVQHRSNMPTGTGSPHPTFLVVSSHTRVSFPGCHPFHRMGGHAALQPFHTGRKKA